MYRLIYNEESWLDIFDEVVFRKILFIFIEFYMFIPEFWADVALLFITPYRLYDFCYIYISSALPYFYIYPFYVYGKSEPMYPVVEQVNYYLNWFYNLELNKVIIKSNILNLNLITYFNDSCSVLTFFLLVYYYYLYLLDEYSLVLERSRLIISILYEKYILTWINFAGIKFESYEEAICIIILWPWCVFLVFTHIFTLENNEVFFIFVEWGLPILYGYLVLLESLVLFGSYFFIYLNGARGRKFLIITIIEDLISFVILISRVTLQIIRGIICGLYHDFFREIIEFTIDNWEMYWFYINWKTPFIEQSYVMDYILFFIDWYIIAFLVFFIYILLFLQLLFLLIAVWLFCRCWFISSSVIVDYNKNNKFLKKRNKNLYKNEF